MQYSSFPVTIVLLILFLIAIPVKADFDAQEIMDLVCTASDASEEDELLWRHYVSNVPQPSVSEVRTMMEKAAYEYNVPQELLEAIGYLENNWIMIGPSIDRGWGIMHLVENDFVDTLGEAADLLGVDRQVLKDDAESNIRGAAALLAKYAGQDRMLFERVEDWFSAVKKITGLIGEDLQEMQALEYYKVLANGIKEINLFNQEVSITPNRTLNLSLIESQMDNYRKWREESKRATVDYPGAVAKFTKYNHTSGRSHKIDTWVNHWIGVGTYAGAVSWFQNSKARASAHFCIRHTDGEVTQVVRVKNSAWHCGSSASKYNNHRSIGIEHEATSTHPEWWYYDAQVKGSGKITKYFADKYDIPIRRGCPGITEHNDMPGCNTDCAGNIPWDSIWAVITGNDNGDPDPDPDPGDYQLAVVNSSDGEANVRKGPDVSYSKLTTLYNGDEVKIVTKEGNWYKVIIPDERTGWIYYNLLDLK